MELMCFAIRGSVGHGAVNHHADVLEIQKRINQLRPQHYPELKADGRASDLLKALIEDFQQLVCGFRKPDGRVDRDGVTLRFLNDPDARWLWACKAPAGPQWFEAPKVREHLIRVQRRWQTERSTVSEFSIPDARATDGEIAKGFILERPGPDTKASGKRLRIPEGTYRMMWQNRTSLSGIRNHLPVPWLHNGDVSKERYIYIHNGNYPRNTDGCLLVGLSRGKDFVGPSVVALRRLKIYLKRVGIENVRLEITSDYV